MLAHARSTRFGAAAVVAVALLAVAHAEIEQRWRCVPYSGTATKGVCAGMSWDGGTLCSRWVHETASEDTAEWSSVVRSACSSRARRACTGVLTGPSHSCASRARLAAEGKGLFVWEANVVTRSF